MENKEFIQKQSSKNHRFAVLLVNFGGPSDLKSVKPFLYNLFSDPVVLNFPFVEPYSHLSSLASHLLSLYRKPLAWFIANIRNNTTLQMYKKIGGCSPLIQITHFQGQKLQELINRNELPIDVYVAFRYSEPLIENVLEKLLTRSYKKIIILGLYPQYSYTTVGSIESLLSTFSFKLQALSTQLLLIKDWYKDEDYIEGWSRNIEHSLELLDLRSTEIIFSAHSIPLFNVKNGDPYERQIRETAESIIKKLNWRKKWHIAYQSKIGPIKWLEPRTDKVIREIAKQNPNVNILVVPISFVCEHVETIYEIGILYKEIANKLRINKFVRTPTLNTDKYLIQALYNQVIRCLESNEVNVKELLFAK